MGKLGQEMDLVWHVGDKGDSKEEQEGWSKWRCQEKLGNVLPDRRVMGKWDGTLKGKRSLGEQKQMWGMG